VPHENETSADRHARATAHLDGRWRAARLYLHRNLDPSGIVDDAGRARLKAVSDLKTYLAKAVKGATIADAQDGSDIVVESSQCRPRGQRPEVRHDLSSNRRRRGQLTQIHRLPFSGGGRPSPKAPTGRRSMLAWGRSTDPTARIWDARWRNIRTEVELSWCVCVLLTTSCIGRSAAQPAAEPER
jgi:hypothetical protein